MNLLEIDDPQKFLGNEEYDLACLNLELFRNKETGFRDFAQHCWNQEYPNRKFKWNWHHDLICDHLQGIHNGEVGHTYFIFPPRHGKSTLISNFFQPYEWVFYPHLEYISVSHNATKAEDVAGISKDIMIGADPKQLNWYQKIILVSDQKWIITKQGNERIRNSMKGQRRSIGMGGGLQGDNADRTLLDDILDAADVVSAAKMLTLREFWRDKISTRFNDHSTGVHIVVNHRLTDKDLIGLIHETEIMDRWNRVVVPCLYDPKFPAGFEFKTKVKNITCPALAKGALWRDIRGKENEMLHPARFGPKEMQAERKKMSIKAWNSQYQGRPSGKEGDVFERKWFEEKSMFSEKDGEILKDEVYIQSWDTAFTEEKLKLKDRGEESSYSVCTTWTISHPRGHENEKYFVLRDMWMGKLSYPNLRAKVIELDEKWKPHAVIVEDLASGKSVIQELMVTTNVPLHSFVPRRYGKKRLRAESASLLVEKGAVLIPEYEKFGEEFVDWCCQFPTSGQDVVDTFSQMVIWARENHDIIIQGDEKIADQDFYSKTMKTEELYTTNKKLTGTPMDPNWQNDLNEALKGNFKVGEVADDYLRQYNIDIK